MNFMNLGPLPNFTAHGIRPALLLRNLDRDRLNHWLKITNAILAIPLDFKYSAETAQSFRNNLGEHLLRAFPNSEATIEVHPPAQSTVDPKDTQPWGFLVQGLSPGQAETLVQTHLWLSQSIGFIAIKHHLHFPSHYVVSLKGMAVNLNEACEVITAVTTQMTTPKKPIHDFLKESGIPSHKVAKMVDECRVIPRGYAIDKKETSKNSEEKKTPSSNSSITMWEIHIPPPFPSLPDTSGITKHDLWVNAFKRSTFQSLKSAKGTAVDTPRICFTCKANDHPFALCPIHEHRAWRLQHPEYSEDESDQDTPANSLPQPPMQRGGRSYRPPRLGRGQNPRA